VKYKTGTFEKQIFDDVLEFKQDEVKEDKRVNQDFGKVSFTCEQIVKETLIPISEARKNRKRSFVNE